ncbi:hypothetical protein BP5796_03293 [Coleophoma crateriformis]|uniref:Protein CFT1 n=1 Tax=Coleophoma crateriformis TaxID=565419 RepID=A0A3D8SMM6_9HELO|nr:hypothetical protein BP5796_03293 [Coleophoma crateriformis]
MQCYTELTPPSAVTHSLCLPFVSADSNNLIVAKTSLLQIFTTKIISIQLESDHENAARSTKGTSVHEKKINNDEDGLDSTFLSADAILQRPERLNETKLVLLAEHTLSGTITSLVRVKTPASKSGGEALLVGFKDAKLSLVEWDPNRPGLSTISIHYYEQDDLQGSPWVSSLGNYVNYVSVDPGSRCAALKFGARNLAILPFKQGDEDVTMDDWDEELDGPRPLDKVSAKTTNGDSEKVETPYSSSFVLRLSALDPALIYPVHLAFLYEYREPTFGILSSAVFPASALLNERKDHLSYMVYTLDLDQKASTTILSITGLPSDLFAIIPLPSPVGGALLLGLNELIHIDQAGKANGVAVNMFAKQCTSFHLSDQSSLEMHLEGSTVQQLSIDNGEMLIVLNNGNLAILSFRMDGRSVSGLSICRVDPEAGGAVVATGVVCASPLKTNAMFLGSESGDSVVLGWTRRSGQSTRRKSHMDEPTSDDEEEVEDEDDIDDDLYGDSASSKPTASNGVSGADSSHNKAGDYIFRIHDSLISIAPIVDMTFGKPALASETDQHTNAEGITSNLELALATGEGKSSALTLIHLEIQPKVIGRFEFPEARGVWTMAAKRPSPKGLQANKEKTAMSGDFGAEAQYDRLMVVSKELSDGAEESDVYALTAAGFEALTGTEFEPAAGSTIDAGTLGNGMRIIQVLKSEVRSYDGDLGLAQILPMYDDDTGAEPKITSASFADPFLLLLRDDASIFVAQCDDNNELEEIEREDDALLTTKWLTGCLYDDIGAVFASGPSDRASQKVMMFLLSAGGALHIYALPNLSKAVYVAEGLCFVPPVLSADYAARRSAARETLTEILVADLGDTVSKSPYLMASPVRPSTDDLTIYEPFRTSSSGPTYALTSSLQFLKIHNPHLAQNPIVSAQTSDAQQGTRDNPMRVLSNLNGYSAVFLPGGSPSFILKSAKSSPKVLGLQGKGVRGLSGFHTAGCDRGFIYIDIDGITRVSQLPANANLTDLGVSARKIGVGEDIHAISYHPPMASYIIATSREVPFDLPKDDDHHRDWQRENISFKPSIEQSFLKLVSPVNWSVIDTVELEPFETVLCMKTLNLEVSEVTNERKQLIAVGTAISRGEDQPTRGRIYVFDVVIVVPEPARPETNKKLKQIAKEDIPRGGITAISEIGTQGFMLVAQGQKCMVRGLKEDGTLLPVAFMDMNTFVTEAKELRGSGLCVMADAAKGVWFTGYTEEPYKMMLFGKSATKMEVVSADLLPVGNELFIVVADSDCNLHIMQYDPEHPKSLQGHLLLHRTSFSLGGHLPTRMALLPRTMAPTLLPATAAGIEEAGEATIPENVVLLTSTTGSISLLSPLSESQYRRLSTLASHLTNTLYHACGLNPRAYRTGKDVPDAMVGARTIVDGGMLMRWTELGSQRRAEVAGRAGVDSEEIREDLLGLISGLGYL